MADVLTSISAQPSDYMLQRRIELMIDTNNKRLSSELKSIKEIVNQLKEEINEIKKNLSKDSTIKAKTYTAESPKASGQKTTSDKQCNKPQFQGFEPGEVAVEKFFYFGNKT